MLRGRPVVGDVGHVALLLVAVVALDGAVVLRLPNLQDDAWEEGVSDFMGERRAVMNMETRLADLLYQQIQQQKLLNCNPEWLRKLATATKSAR